jgi:hypothetical protein
MTESANLNFSLQGLQIISATVKGTAFWASAPTGAMPSHLIPYVQRNLAYWTSYYWDFLPIGTIRWIPSLINSLSKNLCLVGNSTYWDNFSWSLEIPVSEKPLYVHSVHLYIHMSVHTFVPPLPDRGRRVEAKSDILLTPARYLSGIIIGLLSTIVHAWQ